MKKDLRRDWRFNSRDRAVRASYLFGYKLEAVAKQYNLSRLDTAMSLFRSGVFSESTIKRILREETKSNASDQD